MLHEVKIHPIWFKEVLLGLKKFETRLNDRNYQERDQIALKEYDPKTETYTGNVIYKRIDYVLKDVPGLLPDYVILQLSNLL